MVSISINLHALAWFLAFDIAAAVWPYQSFETVDFHPPNMTISKTGATADGYLFFGTVGAGDYQNAPLIMTDDNELIWQGNPANSPNTTVVGVQTFNGQDYLAFWSGSINSVTGLGYGYVQLLDSSYEEQYRVTLPNDNFVTADGTQRDSYIDLHELYITDSGTVLVTAKNVTQADITSVGGSSNGWVVDSQFYEIDIATNTVIFSWKSLDHLDEVPFTASHLPLNITYGTTVFPQGSSQSLPWDYFHINSVAMASNASTKQYLVSSHHAWQALWVSASGAIDYILDGGNGGDFELEAAGKFSWQHDIRAISATSSGATLHLHDNKAYQGLTFGEATVGLALNVDFDEMSVTVAGTLQDPSDPVYSLSQGSYQPLEGGNVLLGHGQACKIKEYDAQGQCIFTAQFAEADTAASYRTYRHVWHGYPNTKPALYVSAANDGSELSIFMSWNGATDYTAWNVFAGDSSDDLSLVASPKRSGFETATTIPSATFVKVQAMDGDTVLGESEIYTVST